MGRVNEEVSLWYYQRGKQASRAKQSRVYRAHSHRRLACPLAGLVARHPIGGSLLAGAVATQFATVFGIWFPGFGLPSLNWPVANGELILGIPAGTPATAATYLVGELSHFTDGVFFALLFALLFHPLIPIRNTLPGI